MLRDLDLPHLDRHEPTYLTPRTPKSPNTATSSGKYCRVIARRWTCWPSAMASVSGLSCHLQVGGRYRGEVQMRRRLLRGRHSHPRRWDEGRRPENPQAMGVVLSTAPSEPRPEMTSRA